MTGQLRSTAWPRNGATGSPDLSALASVEPFHLNHSPSLCSQWSLGAVMRSNRFEYLLKPLASSRFRETMNWADHDESCFVGGQNYRVTSIISERL